jgi:hypothetical protein
MHTATKTIVKQEKLGFASWVRETETTIGEALQEILDRDWVEDEATRSWMKNLRRRFQRVEIADLGRPYAMAWDTVKLKGKAENRYGDIGVLVRIDYPNGVQREGVGFVEAKRIYPSGRYEELRTDQLDRMVEGTPHHRLVLYERTPILEAAYGVAGHGMSPFLYGFPNPLESWNSVLAAVVPTKVALEMRGNRRRDLHPASLPLSYQLCARYLGGYDLDTSRKVVDIVRNGGAGAPSFLIIASVTLGGETSPSTDNLLRVGPDAPYDSIDPDQTVEITRDEPVAKQKPQIFLARGR